MTTQELITQIENLNARTIKEFRQQVIELIQSLETQQVRTHRSSNPPKEIDGITHYFCRYHQTYEPEDKMIMSNGKSKGYCKAGNAVWNKIYRRIQTLKNEIADLYVSNKEQEAQSHIAELRELELALNSPNTYNLEADWESYNSKLK